MSQLQKVIKYGAIAFGIFLAIHIIGAIIFGVTILLGITTSFNKTENITTQTIAEFSENYEEISKLKIQTSIGKLTIKQSNQYRVEAANVSEEFVAEVKNGTLTIRDDKTLYWAQNDRENAEIIVYLPEDIVLEEAEIKTGANITKIESLMANKIDLELGVGTTQIDHLYARKLEIEAGVGKVEITNATCDTLDLNTGMGEVKWQGTITNSGDIRCGVGKVDLELLGTNEDYQIRTKTGLGNMYINNTKMEDNEVYGNGNSKIKVEGGIGSVTIKLGE